MGLGLIDIIDAVDDDEASDCSNLLLDDELIDDVGVDASSNDVHELIPLSAKSFRNSPFTHFDVLFLKNKIKWPEQV